MKLLNIAAFTILLSINSANMQAQNFDAFLHHYKITKDFVQHHDRYDQDMKKFYDSYNQLMLITREETTLPFKSDVVWYVFKTTHTYLKLLDPVYELIDQAMHNPEWNKNHHYWLTIRTGVSSIIKRNQKEIALALTKADSMINSYIQIK